jgi:hypothetical protein
MISNTDLFLIFGYIPDFKNGGMSWLNYDPKSFVVNCENDQAWWINQAAEKFRHVMKKQIAKTFDNDIHILPLSGGCDSRAILGGLLENLPKSQIVTVTYGIPGT